MARVFKGNSNKELWSEPEAESEYSGPGYIRITVHSPVINSPHCLVNSSQSQRRSSPILNGYLEPWESFVIISIIIYKSAIAILYSNIQYNITQ